MCAEIGGEMQEEDPHPALSRKRERLKKLRTRSRHPFSRSREKVGMRVFFFLLPPPDLKTPSAAHHPSSAPAPAVSAARQKTGTGRGKPSRRAARPVTGSSRRAAGGSSICPSCS